MQHEARCRDCSALGWGKTKEAALDALAEWLDVCPRCGGKAKYIGEREHFIECANPECTLTSPLFHTKRDAAAWWNERAARK
jgi:DnaJ-class molecular chaperone